MTTALEGGEGSASRPRPLFTPGKDPVPIVHEAGWASVPVWTGAENLVSTGIRSSDLPARSQSLYRLSYPAHARNGARSFYCHVRSTDFILMAVILSFGTFYTGTADACKVCLLQ